MPYIQFDLPRDPSGDDFTGAAESVANLYAEVMQTTPSGVTVAVRDSEHGGSCATGIPWSRSAAISAAAGRPPNARPSQWH